MISPPFQNTLPPLGRVMPLIRLNSVVLPAPLGPSNPKISPSRTARLTPSTATSPPKRQLSAWISSSGGLGAFIGRPPLVGQRGRER